MTEQVSLPAQPLSVRQARRFVSERVLASGLGDLRSSAELLTSEVVTNAVVHAGTDIVVVVIPSQHRLRVEVTDGLPPPIAPVAHDPDALDGRGLHLVEAISTSWGVMPAGSGKTVWFELSLDDAGLL